MLHARTILTGAVCATALCIGGLLGPPGAALALLAAPLPALVVGGAAGAVHAGLSSLAAGGLVGGFLGWPVGAAFLILGGVPAAIMVGMLRRAWRLEPAVGAAAAGTLLGAFVLAVSFLPDVTTWRGALVDAWRASFDGAVSMYRDLGMPADQLAELEAARDDMAHTTLRLLPALFIVTSVFLWLANLRVSSRWIGWPQVAGLSRWRAPDILIWLLIGAGFAMFVPLPWLAVVATNVFAVTLACYFAQGLAIVSFFLQRYGLPRGLRVATYIVIAFQYIAAALVVAVGVFDLWGDFRHLAGRPADATIGPDTD
jgi:uncharacterized protein YybS (DUF2232 family)